MADFPDVRLHVVTGKGGTGKTTVAAALALALAGGGKKVLLVEVEGRQALAQLFDTPPLPYEERKVAVAPGGGDVYVLSVDPEDALLDYLHIFYKLSPTGVGARTLRRMGAIEFATTIAPGLRDVLLTGKVKEAVVRKDAGGTVRKDAGGTVRKDAGGTARKDAGGTARKDAGGTARKDGRDAAGRGGHVYDAVVLDAPPTGRIARFLNISSEIGGLAKVGPLKTQSDGVMAVFRSPRTAVHLVTLLEEMPVQETIDGAAELAAVGLPVGGVVVNAVRAPLLSPIALRDAEAGTLDAAAVAAGLEKAGLDAPDSLVSALLAETADHATRVALEERGRDALAALKRPSYELPLLPDAVDLSSLYELAGLLKTQGLA